MEDCLDDYIQTEKCKNMSKEFIDLMNNNCLR